MQQRKRIVAFLWERVYDMVCKISRAGVNPVFYQERGLFAAVAGSLCQCRMIGRLA